MDRRFLLSLLVLCATAARVSVVRADDARTPTTKPYLCHWTNTPIILDGKGDEPAWQRAPLIEDFKLWWLEGDARKPRTATKARLLWDREYLYFLADMEDADLYANTTEHQSALWEGDVFELFLKPDQNKPAYYEFEVNPANATLELFLPSRNSGGWVKYRSTTRIEMKTAVQLRGSLNRNDDRDEGWSVEGRIPWRDLDSTGGCPKAGDQWTFSFCRGDVSVDKTQSELSSSAPLTKPEFHRYEDYAPLKFVGPEQAVAPRPDVPATRTLWTHSKVVGSPDGPMPYTVARVFPKLKIFQPLYFLEEPGTQDCLLLQHLGNRAGPCRLLRFRNDQNADAAPTLLDLDGLAYGMTLHPDFIHNGYLYILVNGPMNAAVRSNRIVRYTIDRAPPHRLDPQSAKVILAWESNGHDGGDLAFGPDGFLYHAAGDGSSDSDANLRGQDLTHLNSAMIRIDVDHPDADKAYSVPKDNPFINTPGARPEIWAYGFRNPWRIAFDRRTGQLWVGQNGQDLWEQVYLVHKGENYGWSVYEGGHPFNLNRQRGPTPIVPPIIDHPHSEMRSLSGGVVYYGSRFPELQGAYIYGDWSTGRIWAVKHDGRKMLWHKELARTTLQIVAFRETSDGELLVIDQGSGLYRLEPSPPAAATGAFPKLLSETGLFVSTKDHTPDPGLIPYDVNAPLWSDGAQKDRFIAIPGDGKLEPTPTRGWNGPEGTVLVKTFLLETEAGNPASKRRIETRLFTKQQGQWAGYTYLWNDEQTDAALVDSAGLDREYMVRDAKGPRAQTWHYPSRAECMTCHSRASNFVLGISTAQLNKDREFGHGHADNQLLVLEGLSVLATKLPAPPSQLPRLADPSDDRQDLDRRARSYLHANCAICHVEAGGGNALMDLEFSTSALKTRLYNVAPQHDSFGIANVKLIAPGNPTASILLERMRRRGPGQMPPLATSRTDEQAIRLLTQWIAETAK